MRFCDITLQWNVEFVKANSWLWLTKRIQWPWSLTFKLNSQFSFQTQKIPNCIFQIWYLWTDVPNPPPPICCRHWSATMWQMKTSVVSDIHFSGLTELQWWRWRCPDSFIAHRMRLLFISSFIIANTLFFLSSFLCVITFRKKGRLFCLVDLLSIKKTPVRNITYSGNCKRWKHKWLGSMPDHHTSLTL